MSKKEVSDLYQRTKKGIETTRLARKQIGQIPVINFPGASTQTPQGRLPPATQEWGIYPNLAMLNISLYDASIGELDPPVIKYLLY